MTWLPIQYRGFWDVPRAFLVERSGDVYYFDAPFDDASDEYAERYSVYRLPRAALPGAEASWVGLERAGAAVGTVPVELVRFDETRRAFVSDAVFDLLPLTT